MDIAKQHAKLAGLGLGSLLRAARLNAKQVARGRQLIYPTNPMQNPNTAP